MRANLPAVTSAPPLHYHAPAQNYPAANGAAQDGIAMMPPRRDSSEGSGSFVPAAPLEHAAKGIFQTTSDGHYVSANRALANLYGYASPAELMAEVTDIGRQLYVDPARRKEFARLMKKNGEVSNFESPIRRRDGSVIWISENAREIRDESGVLQGYEGTVIDITSRVQAENERRKAEEASRAS